MVVMHDADYNAAICAHYREILKALITSAVVHDKRETIAFLGDMLKPMMTENEQEGFRAILRTAKDAAKRDAETMERNVANNLKKVVSHVPQNGSNPSGGAIVTNPEAPKPIKPNDGATVAVPSMTIKEAKRQLQTTSERIW